MAVARFPTAPSITGLCVVMLELGEFIPPGEPALPTPPHSRGDGAHAPPSCSGYQPARRPATGKPANLRHGQEGAGEAYLCISRAAGAPIIDVGLVFPHGAAVKPMVNVMHLLGAGDARDSLPSLGQARPGGRFVGTAGQLEHEAQQARPKLPFGLEKIPLIGALPRLGPPAEALQRTATAPPYLRPRPAAQAPRSARSCLWATRRCRTPCCAPPRC